MLTKKRVFIIPKYKSLIMINNFVSLLQA